MFTEDLELAQKIVKGRDDFVLVQRQVTYGRLAGDASAEDEATRCDEVAAATYQVTSQRWALAISPPGEQCRC